MNELIEEFDRLVNLVKESTGYQNYQKWKTLVSQDEDLVSLIEKIKNTQKDLVKKTYQDDDLKENVKSELILLNQQLESNPVYHNYLASLNELNALVDEIKYRIESVLDQVNQPLW